MAARPGSAPAASTTPQPLDRVGDPGGSTVEGRTDGGGGSVDSGTAGGGGSELRIRPRPSTLESVAALAGVSRATAGRVLTGTRNVNPALQELVRAAAAEVGYVANHAARSLVTRRSDSVAFVISESEERFFADPFFALVLRGAHQLIADRGMQLVFLVVARDDDRATVQRFAGGGHIDGAIFVSVHGADPLPATLSRAGVPVVLSGRPHPGVEPLPHVDADNVAGAREATQLLLDRGCRRVATITGPADMPAATDRLAGFRAALAGVGQTPAPGTVVAGDFSMESGREAMEQLLGVAPDLDGVFAANDLMAIGAVEALRSAGRRIPDDVAVVGYDDIPMARVVRPGLTTVAQPLEAMGRRMAQMLLDMVDGVDPGPPVVLPTTLVRRDTA